MRLYELFDSGISVVDSLRNAAIEILTPLLANKVPFVTTQSMIDSLREMQPGIYIDRSLIMKILNPDTVKSISKIQGDRIYLQSPDDETVDNSKEKEEDNIKKIKDDAIKQASKDVTGKDINKN